ncbi:hypothetical protein ACSBR2_035223 [Camellia fascicularis]
MGNFDPLAIIQSFLGPKKTPQQRQQFRLCSLVLSVFSYVLTSVICKKSLIACIYIYILQCFFFFFFERYIAV